MSLRDIRTLRPVTGPRGKSRPIWDLLTPAGKGPHKLTPHEFKAVHAGIVQHVITPGLLTRSKIVVPGFWAGTYWQGKPWLILYDKVAAEDERLAAWMYGLMCQYAFIHDAGQWWCGQTTYNGHTYPNTFYFQQGWEE